MKRTLYRGSLAVALFSLPSLALVATGTLHAQRYLGAINGQVQDSSGAKIPDADVTAVEVSTNITTKVKSDEPSGDIIPNGDIIFVVGPEEMRLRVQSHCLRAASPVFDAMFGPN